MNNSKALRKEALEIVNEQGLLQILEPFGEARLVGSVALDLVVKPDIDIHLLLNGKNGLSVTKEIAGLLILQEKIQEIRISEYLESDSLKIGIDCFSGSSTDWSIDIWITSDESTTGFESAEDLKKHLSPEQREVILNIKRYYYEKGQLRDGLSTMIYGAVLEEGVSGFVEFQDYLDERQNAA